uniref:Uncharacterized protein n=1 Tax=Heliothis virescens TaxID=7102 RepID=A0A2A4J1B0_HELVI
MRCSCPFYSLVVAAQNQDLEPTMMKAYVLLTLLALFGLGQGNSLYRHIRRDDSDEDMDYDPDLEGRFGAHLGGYMRGHLFLGIIVLSCQANRYDRISFSPNRLYISRQRAYREPGYEITERYRSRGAITYGDPVHHGLLVPYVDRAHYLRTDGNTHSLPTEKLVRADYDEPISQSFHVGPKTDFAEVDKIVLNQLSKEERNFIKDNLTPIAREALLARVERGGGNFNLHQDRFGGFSLGTIAAELSAGAGQFIGAQLAGPLGAQLGSAIGAYLAVAAAEAMGHVKGQATVITNDGDNTNVKTASMRNPDETKRCN